MAKHDDGLPLSRTQRTVRKEVRAAVLPLLEAAEALVNWACTTDAVVTESTGASVFNLINKAQEETTRLRRDYF